MGMNLKKFWPLFGAMCVSLFATASAGNYQYSGSSQASGSTQQSDQGTYREITPVAGPKVAHGADVFITADFIWWKAVQEGTQYATSGGLVLNSAPPFTSAASGHIKEAGEAWAPGFKVGLGLKLSHDGWDLYAQYTWLRPDNHTSTSNQVLAAQNLAFGGDDPILFAKRATANWDLHFNVIDLEMGRNFYLSQFFTMRPFIGFKGTWQDQDMSYRYSGPFFVFQDQQTGNDVKLTGPYHIHEHLDVWGIGVRGGFNVAWYMSKNWSFYGDFAWTTMWANYHDHDRRDQMTDETTQSTTTLINIHKDNHYSVKYVGELELGLRWEMWFYDDNYHFAIQAGWEEQAWVNWASFIKIFDEVAHDLNFHGLNIKFRFDF